MLGAGVLALPLALAAVIAYYLYTLPLPTDFRAPERPGLTILAADGSTLAARGASQGRSVTLEELPRYLVDAVVTMEDRRFFEHAGVDLRGMLRAAYANLSAGAVVQGGSTITQQVARLEFLSAERSFSRKIQEALLAVWLERRLSKREILTRYLNAIYLGAGAHGIDAAARRYFGKPASNVSLAEAAMLAGLIPAPSRFAPTTSPEAARQRAALVLDTLVAADRLSAAAAADAKANPANLLIRPAELPGFGYVADWAAAEANRRLEGVGGDFRVATTIDPTLQQIAVDTVARGLRAEGAAAGVGQAALVAMDGDGRVLAMVGGADYTASQFNRAVQARRQPGSAFKLFVYLAAFEAGFDPESRIADAPVRIGKWGPQNYTGRFEGHTTLRRAFARSLNAATVRLQEEIGRDRIIAQARALGIRSPLAPHPSLALGTNEVSLLELTAAYAAVKAGRGPVEPAVVTGIESLGAARFAMPAGTATAPVAGGEAMLSLLREVVQSGTGKAAALPIETFGKTGTSQDYRDAWFIGFAGDIVAGVWVGNDDRSPMGDVTGGRLPARIWRAFMAQALGLEPAPAPVEDLIAEAEQVVPAGAATAAPLVTHTGPLVRPAEEEAATPLPPIVEAPIVEAPVVEVPVVEVPVAESPVAALEGQQAVETAEAPAAPDLPPLPRAKPRETLLARPAAEDKAPVEAAVPPLPKAKPRTQLAAKPAPAVLPPVASAEPPRPKAKPRTQLAAKLPPVVKKPPAVVATPRKQAPAPPKEQQQVAAKPPAAVAPPAAKVPQIVEVPPVAKAPQVKTVPPADTAPPDRAAEKPEVIVPPKVATLPQVAAKPPIIEVPPRSTAEPLDETPVVQKPQPRVLLIGIPNVVDTATLQIGEHWVMLEGVDGLAGPAAREMVKYIGGREVVCRPTSGRRYRCEVDGWDLSEVVLYNGGGRAAATASTELVEAERNARSAGRGLWRR